ncbi:Abi family protein [Curtobacterium flaccumfaciens]|nr:Abi family protein [Curtobacterium flaccumfaciens]
MAHARIPMSQYRAEQFRHALHVHTLDTSDASVLRTHDFDSELRSIALALTERIEIALRGRVDRAARHRFGKLWHLDPKAFRDTFDHDSLLRRAAGVLDRANDPVTQKVWRERALDQVPFGMLAEELSFGELSRMTGALEPRLHDAVALAFRLPAGTLRACLHHITHVRNCCAHHTRLWGRSFRIPPPTFRSPADLVARLEGLPKRTPVHSLELLAHLAETVGPCDRHADAVRRLIDEHDDLIDGIGGRPSWASR